MSDRDDLERQNEALRRENAQLLQRVADTTQALEALAHGEVDAVAMSEGGATPLLLRAAQESMRRQEHLLRSIFDGALDAILLADDRGAFVDANPAACVLFDLPRESLVGRNIWEFAPPASTAESDYALFKAKGRMRGTVQLRTTDGKVRDVEFTAVANVAPGLHLSVLRDVTDRMAVDEAVRRSEVLLRAVIEKSAEIISLTPANGPTRNLTPAAWRQLGWEPHEIAGKTMRSQLLPEDRKRFEIELDRLVKSGARDTSMELRVRHRDGSIRWFDSTGTNLLDDPDVAAIVGNYRDITSHKHAEEALRRSRDLLEEAQALAHVGSFTAGLGLDDEVHWTRECGRIFGIPEGVPMTVRTVFERVPEGDRPRVERANRDAVERGIPLDIEHRVDRGDGSLRWVHARGAVERPVDESAAPRMVGVVQDITERRAALEALQASEDRYRRIVENTSEGVWIYDATGLTTFMNARMAELLGYTVEEAVGRPVFIFMNESDHAVAKERIERRRMGTAERSDFRLQRKDATPLWVSIQANPLVDDAGRVEAVLCLITDISAQRLADQVRSSLAAIVESSEDAIMSVTAEGRITSWNAGAEKLYQYSDRELLGASHAVLIPPEILADERALFARVMAGEAIRQHETKRVKKDGSVVEVSMTLSPVRDALGAVTGVSKITRDLTAQRLTEATLRRTEEHFRQAQKMEAVGRLAGGIAHDFNNLLTVIHTYAELAVDGLRAGDPLREDLAEILDAGRRATELTQQLLAFSRQQVLQPRVIDLNKIIGNMHSMLKRLLGEDIDLAIGLAADVGFVLADPGQVEQVVMNLTVNARDAMPEGGKLTIETQNVALDAASGTVAAGSYVVIAVSDSGSGMDAETRGRIFEPFFTTKEVGKGTGLGLSTVFGIVKQSGGHIGVYSEPGQGSTFKVYLPRTDRTSDESVATRRPAVLRGTETVLLVEDEAQVRTAAHAVLRRFGYRVIECANGHEALALSKTFSDTIHVMLTDVVMPGMSGRRLAEQLSVERPTMKVIFASGYTDDAVVRHGVLEAGVHFLQKPFTPETLARKVRDVLDGTK